MGADQHPPGQSFYRQFFSIAYVWALVLESQSDLEDSTPQTLSKKVPRREMPRRFSRNLWWIFCAPFA